MAPAVYYHLYCVGLHFPSLTLALTGVGGLLGRAQGPDLGQVCGIGERGPVAFPWDVPLGILCPTGRLAAKHNSWDQSEDIYRHPASECLCQTEA